MKKKTTFRLPKLEDALDFLSKFLPMWIYLVATVTVSLQCITISAGSLGDIYLAAVGVASMIQYSCLYTFMQGYTSVMDVYAPQLVGRGEKEKLGKLTVKVLLQGTFTFVLIMPIWAGLIFALRLFPVVAETDDHHDESIREQAEYFLAANTASSLLDFCIETSLKFFTNQGSMRVVYTMAICQAVLQSALSFITVSVLQLGVDGILLGVYISRLVIIIGCVTLGYMKRAEWELRGLVDENTWKNWGEMVWCGLTSGCTVLFLYVSYVVASYLSLPLGRQPVESVTLLMRFECFIWPSTIAVAYTSALQVGKALGEGDPEKVKTFIGLNLFNLIVERGVSMACLFAFFRIYLKYLTSDLTVLELSIDTTPIFAANMFFAGLVETLGRGILIVFGKTGLVSGIVIVGNIIVGAPVMILLVYMTDTGVQGIFLALLAQFATEALILTGILAKTDLRDEVALCDKRVSRMMLDAPGEKVSASDEAVQMPTLEESSRDTAKTVAMSGSGLEGHDLNELPPNDPPTEETRLCRPKLGRLFSSEFKTRHY